MNYSVSAVGACVIMLLWIRSHLLIQHQQGSQTVVRSLKVMQLLLMLIHVQQKH